MVFVVTESVLLFSKELVIMKIFLVSLCDGLNQVGSM